jgi:predicted RNA-binding protein with PIN domain
MLDTPSGSDKMMGPRHTILLVDGYNVINRVPELRPSLEGGLENARTRLALQVSSWHRTHPACEPVIVFDGDAAHAGGLDQRLAGVRCLFSKARHGGDEEIIRLAREYRAKGADVTVVSDDNKVGNNSRVHGAAVRPSAFIMEVKAPRPPSPSRAAARDRPDAGRGIGRKAAGEIDRELKKKFGI